jgi:hypothetical protein
MAGATAILILMRCWYLARLFPSFAIFSHAFRAMWPTIPAAAAVLLIRELGDGTRGVGSAVGEAALYGAIVIVCTLVSERALLREMVGYLRGPGVPTPAA